MSISSIGSTSRGQTVQIVKAPAPEADTPPPSDAKMPDGGKRTNTAVTPYAVPESASSQSVREQLMLLQQPAAQA